jgi:hypothetical protein
MSNRNNLPNHNDDDTGDEVDSSDGKCEIYGRSFGISLQCQIL